MSMGITYYWSGLTFPSSGNLPDTGFQHMSPVLAGKFFATEPERQPITVIISVLKIEALKNNNIFKTIYNFGQFQQRQLICVSRSISRNGCWRIHFFKGLKICPGCQRQAYLGICAGSLSFSPWATDIFTAWDLCKCINRSTVHTLPFKIRREKADNHWFITILKIFWVLIDIFLINASLRDTFHISS